MLCTNSNPIGHIYKDSYTHSRLQVIPRPGRLFINSWPQLSLGSRHDSGTSWFQEPSRSSFTFTSCVTLSELFNLCVSLHLEKRGNETTWSLGFLQRMWRAGKWDWGEGQWLKQEQDETKTLGQGVEKKGKKGWGRKMAQSTWYVPKMFSEKWILL